MFNSYSIDTGVNTNYTSRVLKRCR